MRPWCHEGAGLRGDEDFPLGHIMGATYGTDGALKGMVEFEGRL